MDNQDDEENNSDVESRLYAGIYYTEELNFDIEANDNSWKPRASHVIETVSEKFQDTDDSKQNQYFEDNTSKSCKNVDNNANKCANKFYTLANKEQKQNIPKRHTRFDVSPTIKDKSSKVPLKKGSQNNDEDLRSNSNDQENLSIDTMKNYTQDTNIANSHNTFPFISEDNNNLESTGAAEGTEYIFKKYKNHKQSINKLYHKKYEELQEMNTKYNVLEKSEKDKIENTRYNKGNVSENDSDSNESILEVPIPPKPQPLVINLQDSDDELIILENTDTTERTVETPNKKNNANPHHLPNIDFSDDININSAEFQINTATVKEIKDMKRSITLKQNCENVQNNLNIVIDNNLCNNVTTNDDIDERRSPPLSSFLLETNIVNNVIPDDASTIINTNYDCVLSMLNKSHSKSSKKRKRNTEHLDIEKDNVNQTPRDNENLTALHSNSCGQENFDINELQSRMSTNPRLWKILDEDLMPRPSKRYKFCNIRCNHCHKDGHARYNCPEPRRLPKCHMCGIQGHTEIRCPQTMCLTCGKRQGKFRKTCETCRTFYCTMCNAVGHKSTECPDLWRRYHQTTTVNMISVPEHPSDVMKPASLLFCCNCTKRGHDYSTCRDYRWSKHFPTPACVSNYIDGPDYVNDKEINYLPKSTNDFIPLAKVKIKQTSKLRAFPENEIENNRDIKIIYSYGVFYTKDCNGQELNCNISALHTLKLNGLLNGSSIPYFLHKLLQLFMFQVMIYENKNCSIILRIRTFSKFIEALFALVMQWLKLRDEEKDYGICTDLPMITNEMIKLVNSKLKNFRNISVDPETVLYQINKFKRDLKGATGSKNRLAIKKSLIEAQLELVLLIRKNRQFGKQVKQIQACIKRLSKLTDEKIPILDYLRIVTLYNDIFMPHTPVQLSTYMKLYRAKNIKTVDDDTNQNVSESIHNNELNQKQEKIPVIVTSSREKSKIVNSELQSYNKSQNTGNNVTVPTSTDLVVTDCSSGVYSTETVHLLANENYNKNRHAFGSLVSNDINQLEVIKSRYNNDISNNDTISEINKTSKINTTISLSNLIPINIVDKCVKDTLKDNESSTSSSNITMLHYKNDTSNIIDVTKENRIEADCEHMVCQTIEQSQNHINEQDKEKIKDGNRRTGCSITEHTDINNQPRSNYNIIDLTKSTSTSNLNKKLLSDAHSIMKIARRYNVKHLNQAAKKLQCKIKDKSLKRADINMLRKVVDLENIHRKRLTEVCQTFINSK